MSEITSEHVKDFLLARYSEPVKRLGLDPVALPDSFDFFVSGVIDSFGILEMISSIEEQFHIELDMATLDPEQITLLGPLSDFVAENANPV